MIVEFAAEIYKIKAELLQESIFFLIHLFARDVLAMKYVVGNRKN